MYLHLYPFPVPLSMEFSPVACYPHEAKSQLAGNFRDKSGPILRQSLENRNLKGTGKKSVGYNVYKACYSGKWFAATQGDAPSRPR